MQTIAERLKIAQSQLEAFSYQANRAPTDVQLLAVSKTKPVSDIVQAYESGQRRFGENYVQEGVEKIIALQQLEHIEWHFIGPLQSNKTRLVAEHFDWMQSLDRVKIASRLNEQRSPHAHPLQVCIQVNIDNEEQKSGVTPTAVMELADAVSQCKRLNLRGLMCIPKATGEQLRNSFCAMQTLYVRLKQVYPQVDTLSMGMSADLQQAIAAGSTMVRLGTAIFGPREKK